MTTQQISRENKASRVSNLRCGWSCQAISVTSVTLYSPSLERICIKSRQSFSRLTRPVGVCGSCFTLENHVYSASHLPKTTVLQSTGTYSPWCIKPLACSKESSTKAERHWYRSSGRSSAARCMLEKSINCAPVTWNPKCCQIVCQMNSREEEFFKVLPELMGQ